MAHYYGNQNPNIKPGYELQDVNIHMPPAASPVVQDRPRWSWCSVVWSALAFIFCCPLFGFIGLLCSSFSYVDHKSGDYSSSNRKRKCAWGWSMTGLVLGILSIVAVIVIFVVFYKELGLDRFNWQTG